MNLCWRFFSRAKSMTNKTKLTAVAIIIVFLASPTVILAINSLQNTTLHVPLASSPVRVACVGDSITQDSEYPSDLQSLLGQNYSVGNFGARGSTVLINSWKPYLYQPELQKAEDFQPDIVVIMLGTNDDLIGLQQYNESFTGDYSKLIYCFQQFDSQPQILIAQSPPIFSNSSDLSASYLSDVIIPKTMDLANSLNLPSVDVYSAFGNHSDYFVDGIHPNSDGAAVIASEVYDSINAEVPFSGEP
jgi:acyl-CoA thioesterase I